MSGLALTRWQITWPPVASAMPRSRYRKKSRRPPPLNSVSPGLLCENVLTTARSFITASTVLIDERADTHRRPIFRQPTTARLSALLCYAKITPNPGDPAWPKRATAAKAKNGLDASRYLNRSIDRRDLAAVPPIRAGEVAGFRLSRPC